MCPKKTQLAKDHWVGQSYVWRMVSKDVLNVRGENYGDLDGKEAAANKEE